MNNYIRVIFILVGVFHLTAGQFGGSQFGGNFGFIPQPFGCECSDFTYFNGVETVGQCLTGSGSGFCYVHMPTTCFDRIESENFRGFRNPDGTITGGMFVSFEACSRRFGGFGGSSGFGPLVQPGFGKEIILHIFFGKVFRKANESEVHSFLAACHSTTNPKHEAE